MCYNYFSSLCKFFRLTENDLTIEVFDLQTLYFKKNKKILFPKMFFIWRKDVENSFNFHERCKHALLQKRYKDISWNYSSMYQELGGERRGGESVGKAMESFLIIKKKLLPIL